MKLKRCQFNQFRTVCWKSMIWNPSAFAITSLFYFFFYLNEMECDYFSPKKRFPFKINDLLCLFMISDFASYFFSFSTHACIIVSWIWIQLFYLVVFIHIFLLLTVLFTVRRIINILNIPIVLNLFFAFINTTFQTVHW